MAVVLTDIQIAFAAGALFADAGAPVILAAKAHSEASLCKVYCRYMLRSLIYAAVFIGPVATMSLLAYPGWESQYISPIFDHMPGNPLNAGYYGVFLMAVFGGGWFGNWLGFRWVLTGLRTRLRLLYISLVVATFVVMWARYPAPVRVGTYEQYVRDPRSLTWWTDDATFFISFLIFLAIAGLPLVIGFVQVRRSVKALQGGSRDPLDDSPVPSADE
jgi:hypothetical protein